MWKAQDKIEGCCLDPNWRSFLLLVWRVHPEEHFRISINKYVFFQTKGVKWVGPWGNTHTPQFWTLICNQKRKKYVLQLQYRGRGIEGEGGKSTKLNDSILCTYCVHGMKSLVMKKEIRFSSCLPSVYILLGKNETKYRNTYRTCLVKQVLKQGTRWMESAITPGTRKHLRWALETQEKSISEDSWISVLAEELKVS